MAKAKPTHYVEVGYQRFVGTLAQCQTVQRAMEAMRTADRKYLDVSETKTKWYMVLGESAPTEVGRIDYTVVSKLEWKEIEAANEQTKRAKRAKIEHRKPQPLLLEYRELPDGGGVR